MEYAERLHVPLRWWVQGTMLVASLWLTVVVAMPGTIAWSITAVVLVVMAGCFHAYGARIEVSGDELRAGRAHIALSHLGAVEVLDADRTRLLAGREADARAYLLLRPYLHTSVRVEITDPADPTPYWLLHTRHPEALARALGASAVPDGSRQPADRMGDATAG